MCSESDESVEMRSEGRIVCVRGSLLRDIGPYAREIMSIGIKPYQEYCARSWLHPYFSHRGIFAEEIEKEILYSIFHPFSLSMIFLGSRKEVGECCSLVVRGRHGLKQLLLPKLLGCRHYRSREDPLSK